MKKQIKQVLNSILIKSGYKKQPVTSNLPNPIHLWTDDNAFQSLYNEIINHTLVDVTRCFILYQFANQIRHIKGEVAEVGVYKGGTAKLISKTLGNNSNNQIYLFDTFQGMPDTDPTKDRHRKGDFSDTSLDSVKSFLKDCNNVQLFQGLFPKSSSPIVNLQFSLVHIDVDIYKLVTDCCIFFYPRMVKGGIMVFDNYGFRSCPGAKMAVDEFFSDKSEYPQYLPTGQCFITKL